MDTSRRWRLPLGGGLSDEVFARRHRTLRILLAVHVPGLAVLGYLYGQSAGDVALAVVPVVVAVVASGFFRRSTRALLVAVGLAYCSAATIGLANGSVEAHYHVLVMIGFVALYQDWVPFVGLVSIASLGYLVAAHQAPHQLFDAPTNHRATLWAVVHIGFLLTEALAMIVFWRATEDEQNRTTALASSLTKAELARTREQAEAREASSGLLSNLARRNQLLLDRQLERIDALEKVEKDPDALAELFSLDHLATRMRRNAESLLVLAGAEDSRGWSIPIPLSEICRGAMAEVEDYARVDVALVSEVFVDGEAVGDLVHLIAELIENATSFSPPTARVLVSGSTTSAGYVLAVSDAGIGMGDAEISAANATLSGRESANIEAGGMLGLHVVSRLAARYDLRVWLQRGQDCGLSALIALPTGLLHDAEGTLPDYAEPAAAVHVATAAPVSPVPQQSAPVGADHPMSTPMSSAFPSSSAQGLPSAPQPVAAAFAAPEPVAAAPTAPPAVPAQAVAPTQPAPAQPSPATQLAAAPLTAAGLQRRIPRASLAAPLSQAPADADAAAPGPEAPIAPERARSVLSAYVGGAHRAREAAEALVTETAPPARSGDQA